MSSGGSVVAQNKNKLTPKAMAAHVMLRTHEILFSSSILVLVLKQLWNRLRMCIKIIIIIKMSSGNVL